MYFYRNCMPLISCVSRRLLGIKWQEHIAIIEVRERTGQPAVSESIRQHRLAMAVLGHLSRMSPSLDYYKAIYQNIPSDWRRRSGRPQQSWLATIRQDLRQLKLLNIELSIVN